MRRLGIDFGSRRVGLALTDVAGDFAYPLVVISNNGKLLEQIKKICVDEGVGEIVLGESLDYARRQNPIMRAAARFKVQLETLTGLPIIWEDETLTTKAASRLPDKSNLLDARSAAIILGQYLARMRYSAQVGSQ